MQPLTSFTRQLARLAVSGARCGLGAAYAVAASWVKPGTMHFIRQSRPFALTMLLACVVAIVIGVDLNMAAASPLLVGAWLVMAQICAVVFMLHFFVLQVCPSGRGPRATAPTKSWGTTDPQGLYRPPSR